MLGVVEGSKGEKGEKGVAEKRDGQTDRREWGLPALVAQKLGLRQSLPNETEFCPL